MRRLFTKLISVGLASIVNVPTWADQGGTALPTHLIDNGNVAYTTNNLPTFEFRITLLTSCFPVNVRNVPNPLAPTSTVTMELPLLASAANSPNGKALVKVDFPAAISMGQANVATVPVTVTGVNNVGTLQGAIAGNTLIIQLPGTLPAPGSNDPAPFRLDPNDQVRFIQTVPPGYGDPNLPQNYVGINGPLTRTLTTASAADGSSVTLNAAFPGAVAPGTVHGTTTGLCGSMYSPLMLFLSDARPSLKSISSFPLRPEGEKFYWPEGSKEWAFLVYDGKNNGKIDSPEQLFGSLGFENGFKALERFDSNKDGKIDKNDKDFAKIKLWFDLNGDGISQKGEVKPLASHKIDSISLKYESDRMMPIGERGQFREHGFAMSGEKKYDVIDVWFGVQKIRTEIQRAKKDNKGEGAPNEARKKKT